MARTATPAAGPAAPTGFALRGAPAPDAAAVSAAPSSAQQEFAPTALESAGAGMLATMILVGTGALLIALMCLDAIGIGPRHDYLRRRTGGWRLPWR